MDTAVTAMVVVRTIATVWNTVGTTVGMAVTTLTMVADGYGGNSYGGNYGSDNAGGYCNQFENSPDCLAQLNLFVRKVCFWGKDDTGFCQWNDPCASLVAGGKGKCEEKSKCDYNSGGGDVDATCNSKRIVPK